MVTGYGKNLQDNEISWGDEYCFRHPADCGGSGDGRVFDCGRGKTFAPEKRPDLLGRGLLYPYRKRIPPAGMVSVGGFFMRADAEKIYGESCPHPA